MDFVFEANGLVERLLKLCDIKYIEIYGSTCLHDILNIFIDLTNTYKKEYVKQLVDNKILQKIKLIITNNSIEKWLISDALLVYNNLLFVEDQKLKAKIYDPEIIKFQPNLQDINFEEVIAKDVCTTISILFKVGEEKLMIDFIDHCIGIIEFLVEL